MSDEIELSPTEILNRLVVTAFATNTTVLTAILLRAEPEQKQQMLALMNAGADLAFVLCDGGRYSIRLGELELFSLQPSPRQETQH